jgi:hypothetical protein
VNCSWSEWGFFARMRRHRPRGGVSTAKISATGKGRDLREGFCSCPCAVPCLCASAESY